MQNYKTETAIAKTLECNSEAFKICLVIKKILFKKELYYDRKRNSFT